MERTSLKGINKQYLEKSNYLQSRDTDNIGNNNKPVRDNDHIIFVAMTLA